MNRIQRAAVNLIRSPISVGVSLGMGGLDWTAAEREATRMAPAHTRPPRMRRTGRRYGGAGWISRRAGCQTRAGRCQDEAVMDCKSVRGKLTSEKYDHTSASSCTLISTD